MVVLPPAQAASAVCRAPLSGDAADGLCHRVSAFPGSPLHAASFRLAFLCRFRLALDRQVPEQNSSLRDADRRAAGPAVRGPCHEGLLARQRRMARRLAGFAERVKRIVWVKAWRATRWRGTLLDAVQQPQ